MPEPTADELSALEPQFDLAVRAIDTGLPVAVHESVSVVRFPDSSSSPDGLFYNPSVNGIASRPIGCY